MVGSYKKGGDLMAKRKRLKLTTPNEVRKALTRVAVMVLNGDLDPKQANTIIYACNVILGAIRVDEQERKIAQLEQILTDMGKL